MSSHNQHLEIIYEAVREINAQLPADQRLACQPETVLFGDGGVLDSLGIINLLVLVEEAVSARAGSRIALLDERLIAKPDGPFRSVAALAEHLDSLVTA